ncbi:MULTISPECIES: hypothetical protein [Methylococcus]|jgi:hypothetical protein|uniref:Uncharacterized protein n=2 Tax=Methylococcus capsulatus TaxID=414 RepID=Q603D2_METCA|nr:hypothetical protein [Methylococcus capsulatus]AAU91073.1 hypothetical protein MCA2875 [Methylococcus capsulatus str. Bath]QXP86655.1 hypothetical protein KW112_09610 [Methylococcus capsulatus]QXP92018.1 hypothetical protein KW114_07815 [Methylococcus capsulatus]QXP93667.1 hypothetical protein KW113_00010 [Methylococcus capsulatus]UQN11620.1 hypothetical protein M3M30_11355 [Methylococcus capsulatus]
MKLVLQIAIGVFLGTLTSQSLVEVWRLHQERAARAAAEKIEAEKAKTRHELSERIRTLLMRGRQEHGDRPPLPPSFVPDDTATGPAGEN